MDEIRSDLVIRLDEANECFIFFTTKTKGAEADEKGSIEPLFSVEISFKNLRNRGPAEAERLIGKSVLGFFDLFTKGRLDLPKHYLDDSDSDEPSND